MVEKPEANPPDLRGEREERRRRRAAGEDARGVEEAADQRVLWMQSSNAPPVLDTQPDSGPKKHTGRTAPDKRRRRYIESLSVGTLLYRALPSDHRPGRSANTASGPPSERSSAKVLRDELSPPPAAAAAENEARARGERVEAMDRARRWMAGSPVGSREVPQTRRKW